MREKTTKRTVKCDVCGKEEPDGYVFPTHPHNHSMIVLSFRTGEARQYVDICSIKCLKKLVKKY